MAIRLDSQGNPLLATDGKILLDTGFPTGSVGDIVNRLRNLLPGGWFPVAPVGADAEQAPVLVGLLSGVASSLAGFWQLMTEISKQIRLSAMSGPFLDMAAADYFGTSGLLRDIGESDAQYRARIVASVVAPRNTRAAVSDAIARVTGITPVIIEPQNASDCHAYGVSREAGVGGGYGYGTAGLRYSHHGGAQFFVETPLGAASGMAPIAAAISGMKAAGVVGWIRITD